MDITYLLAREQISLAKARCAASVEARAAHAGLARGYAEALAAGGFPPRAAAFGASSDTNAGNKLDRNPAHA